MSIAIRLYSGHDLKEGERRKTGPLAVSLGRSSIYDHSILYEAVYYTGSRGAVSLVLFRFPMLKSKERIAGPEHSPLLQRNVDGRSKNLLPFHKPVQLSTVH